MKKLLTAAMLALFSQASLAHTLWVMPSHFVLSGEDTWISVDLSAANMTFVADKGVSPDNLSLVFPDGSRHKFSQSYQGKRKSQADHQLVQEGTYLIENGGPARYFTMFEVNGERKRIMADKRAAAKELPAGATKVTTSRGQSKALAVVTVKAPNRTALDPKGDGFELNFITHPADYVAEDKIEWQLLMDGKPAAGVKVELSQQDELYRNAAGRQTLETDNAGKLAFIPAQAGRYLIEASYQSAEKTELADQIRATLTLTFEVGLP
ncbi:cobalt ABC transporter substrate-binding protein [Alishewanella sp. WH16-1]|uniref:DUF4198 domain-containing protein n=1 Tax=Alishewanella sp. WH16-1 TaxID=1651088 RepID=UPI00070EFEA5|nr:DUF4198 domain-containing protein [Alishewanella sp. WH16-1]KRS21280.1 cobalt ABC transporter substrate-binding protein [Alishewanella sp. WH16-1]